MDRKWSSNRSERIFLVSAVVALLASILYTLHDISKIDLSPTSPTLSVIIPCYNCERWLNETLASLQSQTFTQFSVILVDDGSKNSVTFDDLRTKYDGDIRVLRHWRNMGLSAARNTGVMAAKGSQFVIFLDPDDLIEPTAFEKLLLKAKYEENDRRCAFIYPAVTNFRTDESTGSRQIISIDRTPYSLSSLWRSNFITSFALIHRDVYLAAGGMCEQKIKWWEDYDFWLRLANLGLHGQIMGDAVFWYRRHSTGRSSYISMNISEQRWRAELYLNNPKEMPDLDDDVELVNVFKAPTCYHRLDDGKLRLVGRLFRPISILCRSKAPYSSFLAMRVLEKMSTLSLGHPSPPMHHAESIMFIIPWMQIGGADSYDLEVMRTLSHAFNIVVVTEIDVEKHDNYEAVRAIARDIFQLPTLLDPLSEQFVSESNEVLLHLLRSRNAKKVYVRNSFAGYRFLKHLSESGLKKELGLTFYDVQHLYILKDRGGWEHTTIPYHQYIDHRIVVSEDLKKRQMYLLGRNARNTFSIISPSVDISMFASKCVEAVNEWAVLFIGRIDEQKNPLQWVRVARILKRELATLKFIVVGDGPLLPQMRSDAAELADSIHFTGKFISTLEIATILATGYRQGTSCRKTILVMTSENEGLPIVILEAISANVSVVAPNIGAIHELVEVSGGLLRLSSSMADTQFADEVLSIVKARLIPSKLPVCTKTFYDNFSQESFQQLIKNLFNA